MSSTVLIRETVKSITDTVCNSLIAIILSRLEMNVDECIEVYKELMKAVFKKKKSLLTVGLRG